MKAWSNQAFNSGVMRVAREGDNVSVVADVTPAAYSGAFKVTIAGVSQLVIKPGFVEKRVPFSGGVPLDGLVGGKKKPVKPFALADGPNEDFRSWVGVWVQVDLKSKMLSLENDALKVGHVNSLAGLYENGVSIDDGKGKGFLPLAMLIWRTKTSIQSVVQDVYFNQRHTFQPPDVAGGKGWHIFAPSI